MDIGNKIKKYREQRNLSQDDLALKVFVSRQTISNWETNKSYPDIKSLSLLTNIFGVSLDEFVKGDIDMMRREIKKEKVKEFHLLNYVFLIEMLILAIAAYPLFKFFDTLGVIIWLLLFIVTFITATIAEKFKKDNNVETYKEILAFLEGKSLTYEERQQEKGKRVYQKIVVAALLALVLCLIVIFIIDNVLM